MSATSTTIQNIVQIFSYKIGMGILPERLYKGTKKYLKESPGISNVDVLKGFSLYPLTLLCGFCLRGLFVRSRFCSWHVM